LLQCAGENTLTNTIPQNRYRSKQKQAKEVENLCFLWDTYSVGYLYMKLKRTKKLFKERIPAWMGVSHAKEGGESIARLVKRLFIPSTPERVESFTEAMQRLGMSEMDVVKRQGDFFRLFVIMLMVTMGVLVYTAYLLVLGHIMAGVASLAIAAVAAALTFRNHFWYFQLKQRTLGLTFKEWMDKAILGKR